MANVSIQVHVNKVCAQRINPSLDRDINSSVNLALIVKFQHQNVHCAAEENSCKYEVDTSSLLANKSIMTGNR